MALVTPAGRQALREKHSKRLNDGGRCLACGGAMSHPCDVIKVLDAYEELYDDNKKTLEALTIALNFAQSLAKMIP